MTSPPAPIVLSIAGHDPSGGAGIQADIEAIVANGARAASAITCLTVQDSRDVSRLVPVEPRLVLEQVRAVLGDLPIAAIKIGLLGSSRLAKDLAGLLAESAKGIPLVLDPVLRAGGGTALSDGAFVADLRESLVPLSTLVTPNLPEARALGRAEGPEDCALALVQAGAGWVLITGTHTPEARVTNRLFGPQGQQLTWTWNRLSHSYHGSGCTLASATAAGLARGLTMKDAVGLAQAYTWNTLAAGFQPGRGQHFPDRLYLLRTSDDE
jgi:hydroxymethylpyrimidine/phosphomethylpyrimidine kinase